MQYYINEWPDQTASLIAEDGYSLDTFENLGDAIDADIYDCLANQFCTFLYATRFLG